jgi:hypothetical protein
MTLSILNRYETVTSGTLDNSPNKSRVAPIPNPTERATQMAEQDFGDFTIVSEHKPVPGVTVGEIPSGLAELLESEYKKALDSADFELVINAKDEATAKKLAGYARAWGAQHTPKLYVKKIPNTRAHKDSQARLSVATWEDVPPESRPGRRQGK